MNHKTNDWASFVGKEFHGKRSGKYKIVKYDIYNRNKNQWYGKYALYIRSLSSKGGQEFPLMVDVLLVMKERFKPSNSMDEAFDSFCRENKIPKLPSQHTAESYYVSFYENYLKNIPKIEKIINSTQSDKRNFIVKKSAIERMAKTAIDTANGANGQQILRFLKNKEVRFPTQEDFEKYITTLVDDQHGLCAITRLKLQFDEQAEDKELLCSLDRIDSDGHYEAGNLQVVCRFVNRWKCDENDAEFRRLLSLVRSSGLASPMNEVKASGHLLS